MEQGLLVGTVLVNVYGECGISCDARSVFYRVYQLDTVSWTAMIAAFFQNRQVRSHKMQLKGISSDKIRVKFGAACPSGTLRPTPMLDMQWQVRLAVNRPQVGTIFTLFVLLFVTNKRASLPEFHHPCLEISYPLKLCPFSNRLKNLCVWVFWVELHHEFQFAGPD